MPNWDTSLVEDMSGYDGSVFQGFGDKSTFNGDISKWNTEKVTTMYDMFHSASAFNQDIGDWNTAQVKNMYGMFYQASAFNQAIGSWTTAEVTNMQYMFGYASAFNHDISSWTGTAATSAQTNMFSVASAFQAKFKCSNVVTVRRIRAKVPRQFQTRAGILSSRNVWMNLQRLRRLENV